MLLGVGFEGRQAGPSTKQKAIWVWIGNFILYILVWKSTGGKNFCV